MDTINNVQVNAGANTQLMEMSVNELTSKDNIAINGLANRLAFNYFSSNELSRDTLDQFVTGLGVAIGNIDVTTDNLKKNTVLYILHGMVEATVENGDKVKPMFKSKEIAEAFEKAGLYSVGYINNLLGINKNKQLFAMFLTGWNIGVLAELRKVANAKDKKLEDCVALLDKDAKDKDNINVINEFMGKGKKDKEDEVVDEEFDVDDPYVKIQRAMQQIADLQLMIKVWGAEIMAEGFDA